MTYLTIVLNKGLKPHKAFEGACLLVSSYYQSLLDKQRQLDDYTFSDITSISAEEADKLDKYNNDIVVDDHWYREVKKIKFIFGTEVEIHNLSAVYEDCIKIDNVGVLFPPMAISEMPSFLQRYIRHRMQ